MYDLKQQLEQLIDRLENLKKAMGFVNMQENIRKLEAKSTDPDLWKDQNNAKKITQELADLKKEYQRIDELAGVIFTLKEFLQEEELTPDLEKEITETEKELSALELKLFLSGEYDKKNAILSIHAGQGGTEAMDWVSILFRMYLKYCEGRGWKTQVLDRTEGEEAGIKSVTFKVDGIYSYGYLKGEAGTHRLVRQSPFNADKLRQTSFALVEALPELEALDMPDIQIKDEDMEWSFFRSSSQGGQNVQKVSTAVRLIHKPTGIVVTAQNERFQERNRENALNLLRGKLWLLQKAKEENIKKGIKGDYHPASWGTQIRSYVLHPYKMIKDLRTGVETGNTDAVLDGNLDDFIEAELKLVENEK